MNRAFVDTSAWYALVDRDDRAHRDVTASLKSLEGRLVTSDYVFDETVTLLQMRQGHAIAVRAGEKLLDGSVELVRSLPEDIEDAWALFRERSDKGWSFTDCVSFAVMRRLRLRAAVATDKHFAQAGFDVLPG